MPTPNMYYNNVFPKSTIILKKKYFFADLVHILFREGGTGEGGGQGAVASAFPPFCKISFLVFTWASPSKISFRPPCYYYLSSICII